MYIKFTGMWHSLNLCHFSYSQLFVLLSAYNGLFSACWEQACNDAVKGQVLIRLLKLLKIPTRNTGKGYHECLFLFLPSLPWKKNMLKCFHRRISAYFTSSYKSNPDIWGWEEGWAETKHKSNAIWFNCQKAVKVEEWAELERLQLQLQIPSLV